MKRQNGRRMAGETMNQSSFGGKVRNQGGIFHDEVRDADE